MQKLNISLEQLKHLLDQQKKIAIDSYKDIGGLDSFQKLRSLNIKGLETELVDDISNKILNCKFPKDFEILENYL